jgi:hypothetical protein
MMGGWVPSSSSLFRSRDVAIVVLNHHRIFAMKRRRFSCLFGMVAVCAALSAAALSAAAFSRLARVA